MISLNLTKTQITEAVVAELPYKQRLDLCEDIDKLLPRWWVSGRQSGLRLTDYGDLNFRLAEIEFYDFKLEQDIKQHLSKEWNTFLLQCNKKIKCPYYLGVNKVDSKRVLYVRFYDSKIAMMVELYGSLKEYLNSVKDNR